jgi:hypothetical protein
MCDTEIVTVLRARAANGDADCAIAADEIERLSARVNLLQARQPKKRKTAYDNKALTPYMHGSTRGMSVFDRIKCRTVEDSDGCWIWQGGCTGNGYASLRRAPDTGKQGLCHRIMYRAVHGELLPGQVVMHTCDKKRCVNPDHLVAGTHTDNMVDKSRKGRCLAILTPAQVLEIRRKSRDGVGVMRLSQEYMVSDATISKILKGQTWKWLEDSAETPQPA